MCLDSNRIRILFFLIVFFFLSFVWFTILSLIESFSTLYFTTINVIIETFRSISMAGTKSETDAETQWRWMISEMRREKKKKHRQTVNENEKKKRERKWDRKWTHSMYTIFSVVIKLYFMIWHVIFFYCDISIPYETKWTRAYTHISTVTIEHVYYDPI